MWRGLPARLSRGALSVLALCVGTLCVPAWRAQQSLRPGSMRKIAETDPRFLSFNVEAVEITGGRFWKPYPAGARQDADPKQSTPQDGASASPFQYRSPVDLGNAKLRNLASALSPAFMRVSGTWMNSTYFQGSEAAAGAAPAGFAGVMTSAEWKGVIDFSHAVHAELVTSVAVSAGTRDASGIWQPDQARALFQSTERLGGHISAIEFANEPTFGVKAGLPGKYDSQAFARDATVFRKLLREQSPGTLFLGPSGTAEEAPIPAGVPMSIALKSEDLMKASGPIYDGFSYHFYTGVSSRCAGPNASTRANALSLEWLDRSRRAEAFYAKVRDEYLPGKPLWLTETGEAACGGDPWAAEFVDTFRFLDVLGSAAQKGVQSVMVNTLASSDYGLLNEETLEPRPDYWAAVLWKKWMGATVLDVQPAPGSRLRLYAHCTGRVKGAVTILVLNLDETREQTLSVPQAAEAYTLTAPSLDSTHTFLNGSELRTDVDGALPALTSSHLTAGTMRFAPASATFLVVPAANNKSCRVESAEQGRGQ